MTETEHLTEYEKESYKRSDLLPQHRGDVVREHLATINELRGALSAIAQHDKACVDWLENNDALPTGDRIRSGPFWARWVAEKVLGATRVGSSRSFKPKKGD
jgi:hypothetical protein